MCDMTPESFLSNFRGSCHYRMHLFYLLKSGGVDPLRCGAGDARLVVIGLEWVHGSAYFRVADGR